MCCQPSYLNARLRRDSRGERSTAVIPAFSTNLFTGHQQLPQYSASSLHYRLFQATLADKLLVSRSSMQSGRFGCAATVAVGASGLFTLSTAGNMAARAIKQHHYKQKLKTSPQCIECTGAGRIDCDICQEAKMIECRNEVYLRAWQICVCPGCEGKGNRGCPNCYGAGVNTAG